MFVLNYTQPFYEPKLDVGSLFDPAYMLILHPIPTILTAIVIAAVLYALIMPHLEAHRTELAKTIETERSHFRAVRIKDLEAIKAAKEERNELRRTLARYRKRSAIPDIGQKHFGSMVVEVGRPICECGRYA